MSILIHPDAKDQFVKSTANQLQVLVMKFADDPLSFDLNGDWLGRKGHQNQILTDFEEATLFVSLCPNDNLERRSLLQKSGKLHNLPLEGMGVNSPRIG